MRKNLALILTLALMFTTMPAFAANVVVQDKQVSNDAIIENNRTYVPMRAIFEALGAKVDWNQDTKTAVGEKEDKKVTVTIGKEGILRNNRTLVPLRFVAESLGSRVEWDDKTKTVYVDSSIKAPNILNNTPINSQVSPIQKPDWQPTQPQRQGVIKGNKNSKIYHMPGQQGYNKISPINVVYFNTESEAQAAGYRKAKR